MVGSALAFWHGSFVAVIALLALIVALALQVGVNYANDYSDGIRGTDHERIGPVRLVGQGLASAAAVKGAAQISFLVAAVAGFLMTVLTQQWIFIPIGLAAIVSAWFYTGGKNPYGYRGLGEIFVFVWFGLAAVLGTSYAQTRQISIEDIILAIGAGAFACAILVVNNLRDIPSDTINHKRTLAVLLGETKTRMLYAALVALGFLSSAVLGILYLAAEMNFPLWASLGVLASIPAHFPGRKVLAGAHGPQLIEVLAQTGKAQMVWAFLTSAGLVISAL
jgi:1,4-dihydroxy-2-naphthoate octaprenyltransferase